MSCVRVTHRCIAAQKPCCGDALAGDVLSLNWHSVDCPRCLSLAEGLPSRFADPENFHFEDKAALAQTARDWARWATPTVLVLSRSGALALVAFDCASSLPLPRHAEVRMLNVELGLVELIPMLGMT